MKDSLITNDATSRINPERATAGTEVQKPPTESRRRYVADLLAAEVSATTRYCTSLTQVAPLDHDDGALLAASSAPIKRCMPVEELADSGLRDDRAAMLLNGNFNSSSDIQELLAACRARMQRGSRIVAILYSPYTRWLFGLANWFRLRSGSLPSTFVTETELRALMRLSDLEVVRIRPAVFLPIWIPVLSWLINKLLPVIPIISRFALAWVVVARSIEKSQVTPSLSIIIPARNERGNLAAALERMPQFATNDVAIIFVEGNSTDDTWNEIQRLCSQPTSRWKLSAFKQSGRGKNDAVRLGFSKATGDLVTILDADLTMPPELLPRFYDAWCSGHGDLINGNRLVYPMEDAAMRRLNLLGNRFFAKALSFVLGVRVGDSLCGTKLLARRDYERLIAWRGDFGDFDPFGDFELLFAASELALGVVDLPIAYRERTYGETNISRFRDGWLLLRMTMLGFFRLKLGRVA